ncbi:hypothetical protein KCU88_g5323, partial [Aureobasidium melanogenum]
MSNLANGPRSQDNDQLMAVDAIDINITAGKWQDIEDEYSDFAEDPEELEIIDRLLLEVATQQATRTEVVAPPPLVVTDIEDYEAPRAVRLPKVYGHQTVRHWGAHDQSESSEQNILDSNTEARPSKERNHNDELPPEGEGEAEGDGQGQPDTTDTDTRSLLDRFRRPPKKPLSVTDLVSPAWCELQYYYVLTKHGRKRRTPAMKQGTAVHQALEDEVHATVEVTVTKKEDSWGLRIWNVIQGLRTLRATGRTRELEVWGYIGGELVNGVIDELSYECPDPRLEEQSLKHLLSSSKQDSERFLLPEYQASIRDYLMTSASTSTTDMRAQGQTLSEALTNNNDKNSNSQSHTSDSDSSTTTRREDKDGQKRIYITDVKTRGTSTLPTGSSIRPTIVQLHLYHHMLENLALGHFSLDHLASRYDLDVQVTFSDSFIAQIGNLNQYEEFENIPHPGGEDDDMDWTSTQDSMDILLQHNNLASLWEYMLSQLKQTFLVSSPDTASSTPQSLSQLSTPASFPTRLSPLLTARYVDSKTGSKLLGSKSIIFNPSFLKSYLYDVLAFWKGERSPKGVGVHDAWKCRVCEFRDGCEWIHERNELRIREVEERRKMREAAGVEQTHGDADAAAGQQAADGGGSSRRSRV